MSYPFKIPFAVSGTQASIPDTDLSGGVNFTTGYTPDYQADPATDPNAKLIGRAEFNFLMNALTSAIQDVQKAGAPQWFPTTDLSPYGIGARVHHAGVYYRSTVANNTATPGTGSGWVADTPTTANTPNTIPLRDGSGNLASTTAVRLATARTINGVAFDGTTNITVTDSSVPAWAKTSGPSGSSYPLVNGNTLSWRTASDLKSDINAAPGSFAATTAQTLATARNINGVPFDGSTNITIVDSSVPDWAKATAPSSNSFPRVNGSTTTWRTPAQALSDMGGIASGTGSSQVRNNSQLDARYSPSASVISSITNTTWVVPKPNEIYVMTGTGTRALSLNSTYITDNFVVGEACAVINSTTGAGSGQLITSAGVSVLSSINGSVLVSGDSGTLIIPKGPSVLIYRAANQWIISSM